MSANTWTPERETRARELWLAGWTAARIADDLGLKSRSSVLSKVRNLGLNRRPKCRMQVPKHAHPLVRRLVRECIHRDVTYHELSRRSGIPIETIQRWGRTSMPLLDNVVAAFNAIGLDLDVRPAEMPAPVPAPSILDAILERVSTITGVPVVSIVGADRIPARAFARHLFCWMAREYTDTSFPAITRHIGLVDHTSAIYGHRRVAGMIASGEIERPAPPPANVAPMRPALALEAAE